MCTEDKLLIKNGRVDSFQKIISVAGSMAVRQARRAGLPVTYVEGNNIIKEYSDGRTEILGKVSSGPVISDGVITLSND